MTASGSLGATDGAVSTTDAVAPEATARAIPAESAVAHLPALDGIRGLAISSVSSVRSPAERLEKTTGLLKVTWITLGAEVTVAPFAGEVDWTRRRSTALRALGALIRP